MKNKHKLPTFVLALFFLAFTALNCEAAIFLRADTGGHPYAFVNYQHGVMHMAMAHHDDGGLHDHDSIDANFGSISSHSHETGHETHLLDPIEGSFSIGKRLLPVSSLPAGGPLHATYKARDTAVRVQAFHKGFNNGLLIKTNTVLLI